MNRRTGVVVVPAGIATADVGVVARAAVVVLVVRAVVAVVLADLAEAEALVVLALAVVLADLVVRAEAEARRVPMVQSSPGTVRPGMKAVRRRVADQAGHCRVHQTSASTPRMPMPRATLVLLAIRASTSAAVPGLRKEIVPRAAQGPTVLLVARHKAMADATTAVPTVVRVPRTPPVVRVAAAVRATDAVDLDPDLVRARARAGRKAADRSRRATIAIGVALVEVAGTSLPSSPRRHRIQQLPRPSPWCRPRPSQRLRHRLPPLSKTPVRRRPTANPSQ